MEQDKYEIGADLIAAVLSAVDGKDQPALLALLEPMHSADIADLIEQIDAGQRLGFFTLWGATIDAKVFVELEDSISVELLQALPSDLIADGLNQLQTDDLVYLTEEMPESDQDRILASLQKPEDIRAIRDALQYPEGTAGRLMQRELVKAPPNWSVGDVIDYLRTSEKLPKRFYDIMIVNKKGQPIGKVPLHSLTSNTRDILLEDLMDKSFHTITARQSQEDTAYAFNQYNMMSAPVVNRHNHLIGIITMDDAMEALSEQTEQDIKLLAGLGDENLTDTIISTTRLRFPWLGVNLITAILASLVIAQFADVIEAIVALAVLMPIITSMGGNAGTQTLTIAVRALATKDLTAANALRIIRREVMVGLLNGLIFAVIIGAIGMVWYQSGLLGVVLGLAMVFNMLVAGVCGILVPLGLDKFGLDPALASAVFVTTITDIIGFLVFLALAGWILL
ncbi:MAG: magnesium transporter [Candidatus Halichondribacter symbioticus]